MAKGTLQMWLRVRALNRQIILGYLDRPSSITWVKGQRTFPCWVRRGRRRRGIQVWRGWTTLAGCEDGGGAMHSGAWVGMAFSFVGDSAGSQAYPLRKLHSANNSKEPWKRSSPRASRGERSPANTLLFAWCTVLDFWPTELSDNKCAI